MDGISQRIKEHVRVHTYYTNDSGLELNLDKELKTFVTARNKATCKITIHYDSLVFFTDGKP